MKKKTKESEVKKPNDSLLKKSLMFIIKIPYFIVNGIYNLFVTVNKNTVEKKVKEKRETMTAGYEKFEVIETKSGDFDVWEEKISKAESKIGIILGARGTGKSALGIKFLENVYSKNKTKMYALGFLKDEMPSWIMVADNIKDIENDAFVLIDEGGILFNSRDSMSDANKFMGELILVARHKNLNILFISQNSANLDVNILRQADYLMLKPSSLLQLDFERKKIKEIYVDTKADFEKYKDNRGITYIYSELFRGFVTNKLPTFWNTKISKSFK
jgi:hypothetical protein